MICKIATLLIIDKSFVIDLIMLEKGMKEKQKFVAYFIAARMQKKISISRTDLVALSMSSK